eukprot:m.321209 g.321209  ORF g.321209 m.321209 type:complete len:690 (+) comp20329_c0_seq4:3-2072(+)
MTPSTSHAPPSSLTYQYLSIMAYLPLGECDVEGVIRPAKAVADIAHVKSITDYKALYDASLENPAKFWSEVAEQFHWEKKWDADNVHSFNYDTRKGKVEISWFKGGKTNLCYNSVDRHVAAGRGDTVAFYLEGNEPSAEPKSITYAQLQARVNKFANALKTMGVKKGDCVSTYMPMIIELVITLLACARIGAIHSVVFGGFSAAALASRILEAKSKVVITADGTYRGSKFVPLKKTTDEACAQCRAEGFEVEHVVVMSNLDVTDSNSVKLNDSVDCSFLERENAESADCAVEWMDAEDPLFFLFTSGSTGKPKGVLHTTGGYMVWAHTTTKYSFDYHPGDIYWCTADIGWITGHTYITYGPLLNGATSVLFEGIPTYPDAGRFWKICEQYKVNQFYTAPTAIRALQRLGDEFPNKYDLSSLRVLGTVGEPINPEAWLWYYNVIGHKKCSIVDTWWQTETGGHCITGMPGATPMKPGSASLPMLGIVPVLLDNDGNELQGAGSGYLAIKQAWPGQMRSLFGDHARFEQTYFTLHKGYYCTGDGARRDEHGYFWITGRVDDVINVSGHRIGTAEIEASLARHKDVVEAAAVAVPHDIKGESIYCYVITREGVEFNADIAKDMKAQIRKEIGPFAAPDCIHCTPGLPKTRSGKIMRRILRKIATDVEDIGDTSTLADSSVIDALRDTKKDAC